MDNILAVADRAAFRTWLLDHPDARECWVAVTKGRPADDGRFCYMDAVEEALCFDLSGRCKSDWSQQNEGALVRHFLASWEFGSKRRKQI